MPWGALFLVGLAVGFLLSIATAHAQETPAPWSPQAVNSQKGTPCPCALAGAEGACYPTRDVLRLRQAVFKDLPACAEATAAWKNAADKAQAAILARGKEATDIAAAFDDAKKLVVVLQADVSTLKTIIDVNHAAVKRLEVAVERLSERPWWVTWGPWVLGAVVGGAGLAAVFLR